LTCFNVSQENSPQTFTILPFYNDVFYETDFITDGVELSRSENNLFNAAQESNSQDRNSPIGTRWSRKSTANSDMKDYVGFGISMCDENFQTCIGTTSNQECECNVFPSTAASMMVPTSSGIQFHDFTFSSWTQQQDGAGVSYTRQLVRECFVAPPSPSPSPLSAGLDLTVTKNGWPSDQPRYEFVNHFNALFIFVFS
jgi:hypothetical protein